jgi:hypothetical protein
MISMRRFEIEDAGFVAQDRGERLPFDDALALIAAAHKAQIETDKVETTRELRIGATLATGMPVIKKVTTHTRATVTERERVLYVFRRSGQTPWLLHENGTHFTALRENLAPSRAENFARVVKIFRERARGAIYDESLLAHRRIPEDTRLAGAGNASTVTTSSEAGTDLLAHVLALAISKRAGATNPYR